MNLQRINMLNALIREAEFRNDHHEVMKLCREKIRLHERLARAGIPWRRRAVCLVLRVLDAVAGPGNRVSMALLRRVVAYDRRRNAQRAACEAPGDTNETTLVESLTQNDNAI
jgi:hypothetical protein